MGYAVAAFGIFGAILPAYSRIDLSAFALLRAMLLDFHYSELYKADSSISAVFFVSFLVTSR